MLIIALIDWCNNKGSESIKSKYGVQNQVYSQLMKLIKKDNFNSINFKVVKLKKLSLVSTITQIPHKKIKIWIGVDQIQIRAIALKIDDICKHTTYCHLLQLQQNSLQ